MTRLAERIQVPIQPPSGPHWVFHRGALGDSILLWPMLRHWRRQGIDVTLVSDRSKARLAARELGIHSLDAESTRFNGLWVEHAAVEAVGGIASITAFLHADSDAAGTWTTNANRMFPGAAITHVHHRPDRPRALPYPLPPLRGNRAGPIVIHVGAGSEEKRWPLTNWVVLAMIIAERIPVRLIAGEVERERLDIMERQCLSLNGGEFLWTLDELAAAIRSARAFISADSGPGHLAAQLGIPTLTLFGPTDPNQWAPVGPVVKVLAPETPRAMDWLDPKTAAQQVTDWSALRSRETAD